MFLDITNAALWAFTGKTCIALAVAGTITVLTWPVKKVRTEWKTLKEVTASIHDELAQQRNNCLKTLQQQGDTQIALLTKVSETLGSIHIAQSEQTGYLKASASLPRPKRKLI